MIQCLRYCIGLNTFWNSTPPEPFASQEAAHLGAFLVASDLGIPHLDEILALELAMQDVLIDSDRQVVWSSCDPRPLLDALGKACLPEALTPGRFELVVESPGGGH